MSVMSVISAINIIDLIEADGGNLKKVATTNGGEYAGPCPFCGGNDRFRVWPKTGRYWCRSCGKSGDTIQYLIDRRGLSFKEACLFLGRELQKPKESKRTPDKWKPRELKEPGELWQTKARNFLDGAIKKLWTPGGESIHQWLNAEKGLSDAIIKAACFGLNLTDIYETRESWGLESSYKDDRTERLQWIPAGLIIPLIIKNKILRLRIRRDVSDAGPRYIIASGSNTRPMTWGMDKSALIIVESELDGFLLNQEAGDLAGIIVLGSAQAKPDAPTHEALSKANIILNALDTDDAGIKAAWTFWPDTYGVKVKRWPCVMGKDPSEAKQNGLDIRAWIVAGLSGSEEKFERFCIQTADGRLSDKETWERLFYKLG